ncbi:hypothetical protein H9Q72_009031 [Fusarium xylarioides]|uniref:Protein kinase domain-containing protein n=1 Tax=Fusarium xylarioides TaxID=221167 RepID=A0A9P7HM88_9HYPO|nr:hypothetical protein H9Q72_009031 [Fusarium xylarioides]
MHTQIKPSPVPPVYFPLNPELLLNGIRVGVKENIDIAGTKKFASSLTYGEFHGIKPQNAPALQRFLNLVVAIIGKTGMSQLADAEIPPVTLSTIKLPRGDNISNLLSFEDDMAQEIYDRPLFDEDGVPTTDTTNGEPLGEVLENTRSLKKWISEIWDQPENLEELQSTSTAPEKVRDENKPYLECYNNKFWKPAAIRINDVYLRAYSDKVDKIVESLPKISTQEVDLLYDLISKIFVYESAQRLSAREILAHPWFHIDDTA